MEIVSFDSAKELGLDAFYSKYLDVLFISDQVNKETRAAIIECYKRPLEKAEDKNGFN